MAAGAWRCPRADTRLVWNCLCHWSCPARAWRSPVGRVGASACCWAGDIPEACPVLLKTKKFVLEQIKIKFERRSRLTSSAVVSVHPLYPLQNVLDHLISVCLSGSPSSWNSINCLFIKKKYTVPHVESLFALHFSINKKSVLNEMTLMHVWLQCLLPCLIFNKNRQIVNTHGRFQEQTDLSTYHLAQLLRWNDGVTEAMKGLITGSFPSFWKQNF